MESWRAFVRRYRPTLYLLADAEGFVPRLQEHGTTTRGGETLPNVIVAYGSPEAGRLSVGTWDASWAGDRAPTEEEQVVMTRQNVGTRLVLAAASALGVRGEAIGELMASVGGAPWQPTTVSIDGVELSGSTLAIGEHRISYAADRGRTVVIERARWDSQVDLVSSTDFDALS